MTVKRNGRHAYGECVVVQRWAARWRDGVGVVAAAVLCSSINVPAADAATRIAAVASESGTGLQVGDVLLRWTSAPAPQAAGGDFDSPLAAAFVESAWGQRSGIRVWYLRNGSEQSATLAPGPWHVTFAPVLDAADRQRWDATVRALSDRYDAAAVEAALSLRDAFVARGDNETAAWLAFEVSLALLRNGDWRRSADIALAPLGEASLQLSRRDRISIAERHGTTRGPDRSAADYIRLLAHAIALQRSEAERFRLANLLSQLATARGRAGDPEGALRTLDEAKRIVEELAPESFVAARIYHNTGTASMVKGEYDAALQAFSEADTLYLRFDPEAVRELRAGLFSNRGIIAEQLGQTYSAKYYFMQVLDLLGSAEPANPVLAKAFNNLGIHAARQGRLSDARKFVTKALSINQGLNARSLSVTRNLSTLADIERRLGNLEESRVLNEEVLAIYQALSPDGPEIGSSLHALGTLAAAEGDIDNALALFAAAREHVQRVAPTSMRFAYLATEQAVAMLVAGLDDEAEQVLAAALAVIEPAAPDSNILAAALAVRARLAMQRAEMVAAERDFGEALRILDRDAPASAETAEVYYHYSRLLLAKGDRVAALAAAETAVDVLERQRDRLPEGEGAQLFLAGRYRFIYAELIRQLIDAGDPEGALIASERYRARGLLAELTSQPSARASANDRVLWERLRRSSLELRRRLASTLSTIEQAKLRQELDGVEFARAELRDRIRLRSVAAPPLPVRDLLGRVDTVLDERAVLLSYFVFPDRIALFSFGRNRPVRVTEVVVDADELDATIHRYRLLLLVGRHETEPSAALLDVARQLHAWLIAPVHEAVGAAERVLIVPDGPLNALSFGALVSSPSGAPRYLVEDVSLQRLQSLAVFHELAIRAPAEHTVELAAFSAEPGAESRAPFALPRQRLSVDVEVDTIAAVFGAERAVVNRYEDTTESVAIEVSRDARFLHFATHAESDPQVPAESFLALRNDVGSDGRLTAQEIVENVATAAELVVLSACETGHGQRIAGEGPLSLARAFQRAGARDVIASLWKVPDPSTTALMSELYANLALGGAPAEALRVAQLKLLQAPVDDPSPPQSVAARLRGWFGARPQADFTHPYYWAAFELIGPGDLATRAL